MAMNGPIQASDFHVGSTMQERNIYKLNISTQRAWSIVSQTGEDQENQEKLITVENKRIVCVKD